MGLSFHYSGSLDPEAYLPAMIEEISDFASVHNWPYHVYGTMFPEDSFGKPQYNHKTYGISITPPKCETVWFCFLSNGRMSNFVNLQFYGNGKDEEEFLYSVSVKTQFAGMEIHKMIIYLFKHISKKYLKDFTLTDEGKYWETNDEQLLAETFERYSFLIKTFTTSIENGPLHANETLDNYFERISQEVYRKMKEKNVD